MMGVKFYMCECPFGVCSDIDPYRKNLIEEFSYGQEKITRQLARYSAEMQDDGNFVVYVSFVYCTLAYIKVVYWTGIT
jgi:predicted small secreted protein